MVTQFCELYPPHRTAVSASPLTVGALDHVRYLEQSGGHMLIESFTARDPFRTLSMSPFPGLPRVPRGGRNCAIENALITPPERGGDRQPGRQGRTA